MCLDRLYVEMTKNIGATGVSKYWGGAGGTGNRQFAEKTKGVLQHARWYMTSLALSTKLIQES